jgi:hypothetical protein
MDTEDRKKIKTEHKILDRKLTKRDHLRACLRGMVEALRYKLEGCRFDSQLNHWNFSWT